MKSKRVRLLILFIVTIAIVGGVIGLYRRSKRSPSSPLNVLSTIAGAPLVSDSVRFEDPYGISVGSDGTTYVTDGATGKLWQISRDKQPRVVLENLDTPSGLALAPDGSVVIAETGAHVIRRVFPLDGRTEVIAGTPGRAGFVEGNRTEALFNGPVGIAVDSQGAIFVADTYNDRIRKIETDGGTRTLAGGGEAGFADAPIGSDARFNTPCGIAIATNGSLVVADTGNHRIRIIETSGNVRTIAGTGERGDDDGFLFASTFNEPVGIAVEKDGTIYVADSRGSTIRACGWNLFPRVWTVAGGSDSGFQDGDVKQARMSHPTGVALAPDGSVLFTDNANKVVRRIGGEKAEYGRKLDSGALSSLRRSPTEMRGAAPGRWPYNPADRPREIAATFGEIRGELTEFDKEAWFHNGLDIPGAYGETVYAIRAERILKPLSVADVGTTRERIRFPLVGYIHLRIGRDSSDRMFDDAKFVAARDADGRITMLRVRRGARFEAGDAIGTLNNQNHVHMAVGPIGNEFNAIAALDLPGIKDTVAPTIESDGIRLFDSSWRELMSAEKSQHVDISGNVRVVVRAYDQMDGNATRRRLGVYRLGYQVLRTDESPAPGYEEPRIMISFESLPHDETTAWIAYAAGSQSGATGDTIFAYTVTNIVRDKTAKEDFLSSSTLGSGEFIIRVFVEDFFGNRSTSDKRVRVVR